MRPEIFFDAEILEDGFDGFFVVIDVIVDAAVANFVGGFNDFGDVIGDFIEFAVGGINSLEGLLELGLEPTIERFPE